MNELLLLLKVQDAGLTLQDLLKKIGMSMQCYKLRIASKRDFKQKEIKKIIDALQLTPDDTVKIFF